MFSPRTIVNLVLFICVLGLAIFLSQEQEQDVIEEDQTLTDILPESIHRIHIERRDLDDIIFQKQGTHWNMQSPYNLPANVSRIQTMLKLLQAHSYDSFSAADNDLTPFMLAVPAVTIQLNDTRIAFGDTNPLEEKLRYVLYGDTVHIINDVLFHQLLTSPTFFLSSKLLPPNSSITRLHSPEQKINVTQDKTLSDDETQIIEAWQNLEAVSVRKYEEVEAIDTIKIQFDFGETIEYTIISNRPNLILARPEIGIQYHISSTVSDNLFPKVETE